MGVGSRVSVGILGCLLAGCGARTSLELARDDATAHPEQMTPEPPSALSCGRTGRCLPTTKTFQGDLGGLAGADRLCQAQYPGSHFFRRDCDAVRDLSQAIGYGELLLGPCWNC